MATRIWIFLINTFFVNTVKSIKNALSLTQDHLAKLTANEADPDIAAMKTAYLTVHNTFITAYNQLNSKLGIYHGQTQSFEEMLAEMGSTKLNEWRGQVFAVFPEGSTGATAIFPQDRQPFQKGTYDQRVEAVETLSLTLATYTTKPTLVALSTVVNAYYITLTGARALQQTDEGSVETLRSNLKAAHKIMCDGLYKNLGLLMAKYYQTPETVENYFDLSLLRDTGDEPVVINGVIEGEKVVSLSALDAGVTPQPDTVFRIKNTSENPISFVFYSANTPTELPGAGPQFTVNAGQTIEQLFSDFDFDTYTDFNVYNPATISGSWEIEIEV